MSSMRAVMRRMPARARLPGDVDRSAMLGVLALCDPCGPPDRLRGGVDADLDGRGGSEAQRHLV